MRRAEVSLLKVSDIDSRRMMIRVERGKGGGGRDIPLQNLRLHPHLHCVIPAGGFDPDYSRWVHPRYAFFLPVKVLTHLLGRLSDIVVAILRQASLHLLRFHLAPLVITI
jgi:hypothetical protein